MHRMPFGAEPAEEGGFRFRLWAPSARSVDLVLEKDARDPLPMRATGTGFYELVTERAGHGSLYRFRVDGGDPVPDPCSRCQPDGVMGPSRVLDPEAFRWADGEWKGRPWEEAVLYELHLGAFTPQGTYLAAVSRLDYLRELGATALELMPVADCPGARNWGYDGVLPFAPASRYGTPEELKELVDSAHSRGLMVFLDVVYNHFGPEGNLLPLYAPEFFTDRCRTPWGPGPDLRRRTVRDFMTHNALYWLEEYHFDGLRLDAVDTLRDDTAKHVLDELAEAARAAFGADRRVHLVLENYDNTSRWLRRDVSGRPRFYTAQWSDDVHHGMHCVLTGESDGYYADFVERPVEKLGRALSEGFAYQGEPVRYRDGYIRGEPSRDLPPTAFVAYLQNHDQVGNRAFGERITQLAHPRAVEAMMTVLLLSPQTPLMFMGEEFAAATPFRFFCDWEGELAEAVRRGRRRESERFRGFDAGAAEELPDPNAEETFLSSKLDWTCLQKPPHAEALGRTIALLRLRKEEIVPRLPGTRGGASYRLLGERILTVSWVLGDGSRLSLLANLSERKAEAERPAGRLLASNEETPGPGPELPPWTAAWHLEEPR